MCSVSAVARSSLMEETTTIGNGQHHRGLADAVHSSGSSGSDSIPESTYVLGDEITHLHGNTKWTLRRCRCRFHTDSFIATRVKKTSRRIRAFAAISDINWLNVLLYLYLQKRPSCGQVWLRGSNKRLPGEYEIVQWQSFIEGSLPVLEGENFGINDQCRTWLDSHGTRKWPHSKRQPTITGKGCNAETTAKKVLSLLISYNCIPPENNIQRIPSTHPYFINLIDPKFKRYLEMGMELFQNTINELYLKGLENLHGSSSEDNISIPMLQSYGNIITLCKILYVG
ncbi:uncharacterized protein LOC126416292 [Schistocerca serialis cubense]|uniref:uncharacterized protein LOC126416292 n=1 Tax=Schistocerca serialis cubense TaxID=2023355 RepID=UPI00214F4F86|nr:uncharacterized protein LOC126416292 [Schistocerca serialis cubense]